MRRAYRFHAIANFQKKGERCRVLAVTEMMGRGIYLRSVTHVVNLETPAEEATYLHRAGRVGRQGWRPGTVITHAHSPRDVQRLQQFAASLGFELHETLEPSAPSATVTACK